MAGDRKESGDESIGGHGKGVDYGSGEWRTREGCVKICGFVYRAAEDHVPDGCSRLARAEGAVILCQVDGDVANGSVRINDCEKPVNVGVIHANGAGDL